MEHIALSYAGNPQRHSFVWRTTCSTYNTGELKSVAHKHVLVMFPRWHSEVSLVELLGSNLTVMLVRAHV